MSSDHNPVILDLEDTATAHPAQQQKRTDWNLFTERLERTEGPLLVIETSDELDEAVLNLTASIQEAIRAATKPQPARAKQTLPQEVRELLHNRNRARRRWQQTADPADCEQYGTHTGGS